ncbi:dimethylarginine dimethylaminohydrolase family protein [Aquimarina muelleri]|uniref:arginine deiminase n=1 Tax=Aquimarina muelleri TaxID=279356 RepID=A0A918JSS7_9FLAO|nr:arginine deiminase-related protein [Aquimarina muelleri]MCX2761150.1 amidinotransferase [Aquimarina muelleri]GGX08664.1 hypothetical protein GCM10007384_08020 [Aquimarina muelleri]
MKLNIQNETSRLRSVVLGTANSTGGEPKIEEAYDPKSIEHIKAGTYPKELDMIAEMNAVARIFEKYDVDVYRPQTIEDYNQIFTRDIAIVIEDKFIKSNMIPDRSKEIDGIQYLIDDISPNNVCTAVSGNTHFEGGDIVLHNDHIFIGTYKGDDYDNCIVARTNMNGVAYIRELFPNKIVKEFDLKKSTIDPKNNALHLDCCFQPVGKNKAIIHKEAFKNKEDYQYLVDFFGNENLFHITKKEMYHMNSNVFSIDDNVVISEKNFTRLNNWLRSINITVEEVNYAEIAKQEGLIRCSTLPLLRD